MLYLDGRYYHPTDPKFAHPPEEPVYPFDRLGARLSRELERVGWDVTGWDIVLRSYGTGDDRWVALAEIDGHVAGARFRLLFNRADGGLGDIGVPHRDGKPPMSLRVGTQLAPQLQVYCGDRWDDESNAFYRWTCLDAWQYEAVDGQFQAAGSRTIAGVTQPEAESHVERWLNLVCDRVAALPERRQRIDDLVRIDPEPLARPVRAWVVVSPAVARRAAAWRAGDAVPASLRFAALPTRAVVQDGTLAEAPDCAVYPQAWLSLEPPDLSDPMTYLVHQAALCADPVVMEVEVTVANDATVMDFAAFLDEQATRLVGRSRLDDLAVVQCWAAAARTAVPLADYAGGFCRPVLLLARELRLDEVVAVGA